MAAAELTLRIVTTREELEQVAANARAAGAVARSRAERPSVPRVSCAGLSGVTSLRRPMMVERPLTPLALIVPSPAIAAIPEEPPVLLAVILGLGAYRLLRRGSSFGG